MTKGLIVSGGHVNRDLLLRLLKNNRYDKVIAVDGGMNPLWVLGFNPDFILGDFDSCKGMAHEHFRKEGVPEITFEKEKDMTDTELALEEAVNLGITDLTILGATGTRMDHTLANLMTLMNYRDRMDITVLNETNCIRPAESSMTIEKKDYKYLSLIPLSDTVKGVTIRGVAYPLTDATLGRNSSFAVSNEIVEEKCALTFEEGEMLVIQSID